MVSHQGSRRLLAATAELTTSTARTGYSPLFASSYLPSAVCLSDTLSRATAPRQSSYLAQHRRRYHAFPGPLQRTLALSPGIRSSQCSNRVRANLSNQIRWKSEKSANPSSGDASAQLRSVGFEEVRPTSFSFLSNFFPHPPPRSSAHATIKRDVIRNLTIFNRKNKYRSPRPFRPLHLPLRLTNRLQSSSTFVNPPNCRPQESSPEQSPFLSLRNQTPISCRRTSSRQGSAFRSPAWWKVVLMSLLRTGRLLEAI